MNRPYYKRNLMEYMLVDMMETMTVIYNNYEFIIEQKNDIIQELQKRPMNQPLKTNLVDETVQLKVDAKLNMAYFNYILKYGVPEDGIFIQSLLDECCEC